MSKNVLVTGAAGFIGANFAEYFLPYSVHFLVPTIAIEFEFNNS